MSRSIVVCVVCLWSSTIRAERLHCANAKHQWPPSKKKKTLTQISIDNHEHQNAIAENGN